jgi:predicted TIM-barrel fold metal-dependent hydrolase
MVALKSLVGVSQIVFGSDFPFASPLDTIQGLQRSGLSEDELRGMQGENARRIFPRWKLA